MKQWIKNKLISYLGISSLEKTLLENNRKLTRKLNELESCNQKIISENDLLVKQFNLSVDINHIEKHNWAVISVQGKPEYVRFIELSNRDIRSLHSFLKQFERTNRTVDSPFLYKGFFE